MWSATSRRHSSGGFVSLPLRGRCSIVGQAEALTENGLTPHEEEMLQRSIEAGEEDLRAGRYTSVRTPEELQAFLDAL